MSRWEMEDLRGCLARLAELREEVDGILAIFDRDTMLAGDRKLIAQAKLKELKAKLKSEYSAGEHDLSSAERAFYFRAVHQAMTSIHVAYNSRPDQRWIDQLLTARSSIDLAASRVEGVLQERGTEGI